MEKVTFKSVEGKRKVKPELPFVKREVVCCILRNPKDNSFLLLELKDYEDKIFVMGGIEKDQNELEAGFAEIKEETGYDDVKFVKKVCEFSFQAFLPHKQVNRDANVRGLLFELASESRLEISEEESAKHNCMWVSQDKVKENINIPSHKYLWSKYLEVPFHMKNGDIENGDQFFN